MSLVIWLIFIPKSIKIAENDLRFPVPYDCEFFIVLPSDFGKSKIKKFYSLGNNTVYEDYGTFSNNGYNFSKVATYSTKTDMNQTTFVTEIDGVCAEVKLF